MERQGRWASLCTAGVAASLLAAIPAKASGWADLAFKDTLFSSAEIEAGNLFIATGAKRSFSRAEAPVAGYIATTSGLSLADVQRFRRGRLPFSSIDRNNRFFFGFERSSGPVFVALGLGPSFALAKGHTAAPRRRGGLAVEASLWLRPDEKQAYSLSVMGDTAAGSLWARARYSYRPAGWPLALGPEVAAAADRTSGKIKAGLALTEAKLWVFHFTMSGGVMWDEKHRRGSYLSAATWVTY